MRSSAKGLTISLSIVVLILIVGTVVPSTVLSSITRAQSSSAPTTTSTGVLNRADPKDPIDKIQTSSTALSGTPVAEGQLRLPSSSGFGNGVSVSSAVGGGVGYNGGPTMHTSVTYAIFWLPNGSSFELSPGNDSSYENLITRFLRDVGGTSYYNILSQYPDVTNGTPLDNSTFGGSYTDTTPYPRKGTQSDPLLDSDIRNEITRATMATGWMAGANKMFLVFTGYNVETCFPNSQDCTFNGFCAYHSYFETTPPVIYADMPDFGTRCTISGQSYPNNDMYADSEINIVSHELFESVSDPELNAWYGSGGLGSEIGDLCAWQFGVPSPDGSNLILNGHKYFVQQEWSKLSFFCVMSYGPSTVVSIVLEPSRLPPVSETNSFNISYTSGHSVWWTLSSYTNGSLQIFVDNDTQVTIFGRSSGSDQKEEWCLDTACSSVIFDSGKGKTVAYYYYDLVSQQVSGWFVGGGSPSIFVSYITASSAPSASGLTWPTTMQLTQVSITIWALGGTTISVTSPANTITGERWFTNTTAWIVSKSSQIPNQITYYHQYLLTVGGGSGGNNGQGWYTSGLAANASSSESYGRVV